MLSKFLLTALVIVVAFFVLRQRHIASLAAESPRKPPATPKAAPQTGKGKKPASEMRQAAYLFLGFTLGLAALLYYYQWQDDHTIVTITLLRDNASEPVHYQVYKYQLQERSFVTTDGVAVTVASSERMEITGLD